MPLTINTNVASLNAQRQLSNTESISSVSALQRISSGLKANSANDDSIGLSISSRLSGQMSEIQMATRIANNGIGLIQTADSGMSNIQENLQKMRELALQSATDTASSIDRDALNAEFNQLKNEITRMADNSKFKGESLLTQDGESVSFQVGSDNKNGKIEISSINATAQGLGVNDIELSSATNSSDAISAIDDALSTVSTVRSDLGATQNRLEIVVKNSMNESFRSKQSESGIRDIDFAKMNADLARGQVLNQASMSVLAQANSTPQAVLSLLG